MRREYESRNRELAGNTVDWVQKKNRERNIVESIAINKQIQLIRDLKREHELLNNEKKKVEPTKVPLVQKESLAEKPAKDQKQDNKEDPKNKRRKTRKKIRSTLKPSRCLNGISYQLSGSEKVCKLSTSFDR